MQDVKSSDSVRQTSRCGTQASCLNTQCSFDCSSSSGCLDDGKRCMDASQSNIGILNLYLACLLISLQRSHTLVRGVLPCNASFTFFCAVPISVHTLFPYGPVTGDSALTFGDDRCIEQNLQTSGSNRRFLFFPGQATSSLYVSIESSIALLLMVFLILFGIHCKYLLLARKRVKSLKRLSVAKER